MSKSWFIGNTGVIELTTAERVQYSHEVLAGRVANLPMLYFRRNGVNYGAGMYELCNTIEALLEFSRFRVYRAVKGR